MLWVGCYGMWFASQSFRKHADVWGLSFIGMNFIIGMNFALGVTECGLLRRAFANTLMRSHSWFGNATRGHEFVVGRFVDSWEGFGDAMGFFL